MEAAPRSSTEDESASLLEQAAEQGQGEQKEWHQKAYEYLREAWIVIQTYWDNGWQYLEQVFSEPLQPIVKMLLGVILLLLLLCSVFIGLFAGLRHKVLEHDDTNPFPGDSPTKTMSQTYTTTQLATVTSTTTVSVPQPTTRPDREICMTSDCIVLSGLVLQSIDQSVDPCEDFYNFATGGWQKSHSIPSDRTSYSALSPVTLKNQQTIQDIIMDQTPVFNLSREDRASLYKLRSLHSSCVDDDTMKSLGSQPLLDAIAPIRRFWFVLHSQGTDKHQRRESLTASLAYSHSLGVSSLFNWEMRPNEGEGPSTYMPHISNSDAGLPSIKDYEDKSTSDSYRDTLKRLLLEIESLETIVSVRDWPPWPWPPWRGGKKPESKSAKALRLANEIVAFEKVLVEKHKDLYDWASDPLAYYHTFSMRELSDNLSEVDLPLYMSSFAPRAFPSKVVVYYPPFVTGLSDALAETSSETLEAYFIVRIALSLSEYLDPSSRVRRAAGSLVKATSSKDKWCIEKVEEALGFIVGRFFAERAFPNTFRDKATEIVNGVKETYTTTLSQLHWMDDVSASNAIEKAKHIDVQIGHSKHPNTASASQIVNYYRAVQIDKSEFFWNMVRARKDQELKKWQKLGKPVDAEEWRLRMSDTDAYYEYRRNEVVLPAGYIRPPTFHPTWPAYMNFGGLGSTVAHEFAHAFDSTGRFFDAAGKLGVWWTNATMAAFDKERSCIAHQYSNYYVDDGHGGKAYLDGNFTSLESIADAALVQAYRAWESHEGSSRGIIGDLLPGLNYTKQQLFFIAYAMSWASISTPEADLARVRNNPHAPSRFRVHVTLVNTAPFAEAFSCKPGSKMNPTEKCHLW